MGKLQLEPKRSSRFPKLHHHSSFAHPGESSLERPEWKTTPTQIDTSKFRFKTKEVMSLETTRNKNTSKASKTSKQAKRAKFTFRN